VGSLDCGAARQRGLKEGRTESDVRVSAIPAAEAVEQPRLHSFELDANELSVDARPQPEVWLTIVAGALTLPIWAVVVLAPSVHVLGLIVRRDRTWRRWRNLVLVAAAGAAATAAAGQVLDSAHGDARVALAGLAAAAVALALGRLPLLRTTDGLAADVVNVARGVILGAFWLYDPLLIPFAAVPAVLVGRSMSLPRLKAEARLDAKTGLYNSRHFAHALEQELSRAKRYARPLSLIMVDLDLLREVNNRYGHLAGDAVLQGVGDIFRAQVRTHDVPARFGGEEFAILLPETTPEQALELAERIRRAVAVRSFRADTSTQPLRATISLGVAAYPRDASDGTQLVHRADLGVYRAKVLGRNRVVDAVDAPD
jgi:diguanylate cyclase (GGDEF)-like protein